jgi:hypothetical protein
MCPRTMSIIDYNRRSYTMWPYAVLYTVCAIWVLNDAAPRRMNWILWAAGTLFLAPRPATLPSQTFAEAR